MLVSCGIVCFGLYLRSSLPRRRGDAETRSILKRDNLLKGFLTPRLSVSAVQIPLNDFKLEPQFFAADDVAEVLLPEFA